MIQKLKSLMETKESIDEINSKLNENKEQALLLRKEITSAKDEFAELKKVQSEFIAAFNENMGIIKEMRENVNGEIYDFKVIKAQTQKKIMEKFEEELAKELKLSSESLRIASEEYKKLKENVLILSNKTQTIGGEIGKFIDISSKIKKEDFELTRFAMQILQADKEKLELMKKIDTLERLISKMRRQL